MKLDIETAQKIVKRAMSLIPYSINVMDEQGVIIASGDPSRVGELHTGAVIVLRKKQPVEIDEQLAKQWHNEARMGINLPISYLGDTIGVIGISGEPSLVRHYAEWVKMAAELIIEQSVLLEHERWQQRYKEEFVRQLLTNSLSPEQLLQQADLFQLKREQKYVSIIIKLNKPTLEQLQHLLSYLEGLVDSVVAVLDLNKIVILKAIESLEQFRKAKMFNELIPVALDFDLKTVVGIEVNGLAQVHISYQSALHTLHYIEKNHPKKQSAFFSDYRLPALLSDFAQSWQGKELLVPFMKLVEADEKGTLVKSLQQYFLSNCDLSHAAEKLFIHPNTLRYRLERIEAITALSFNKIEDKLILYLGVFLAR